MRNRLPGVVAAVLTAASLGQAQAPALDSVLDRMGAYLLDYEMKVVELAADEQYDQSIKRRPGYGGETVGRRKLKSTFFLVRLPDGQAWFGFRDVTSVDGRAVPATSRSMAQLLTARTVDAYEEALAITRANAKYNIGDVYRTINVPLHALQLLHPQNRNRFTFRSAGNARVGGQEAVVVEFAERARPTLISDGFGGDLLSHGRAWVHPDSGAVVRTELAVAGFQAEYLKGMRIRVEFRRDARLQILLPSEMEETYELAIEVVRGRATYRNYKRFETSGRLLTPPE